MIEALVISTALGLAVYAALFLFLVVGHPRPPRDRRPRATRRHKDARPVGLPPPWRLVPREPRRLPPEEDPFAEPYGDL